jgi:hypothetical protein
VAMRKVDGVQDATVSLKEGMTVLDLKPGNTVTLTKLREIIKNNGFVSKEATIVAAGQVLGEASPSVFVVGGTGERVPLVGQATGAGQGLWRFTSQAK